MLRRGGGSDLARSVCGRRSGGVACWNEPARESRAANESVRIVIGLEACAAVSITYERAVKPLKVSYAASCVVCWQRQCQKLVGKTSMSIALAKGLKKTTQNDYDRVLARPKL